MRIGLNDNVFNSNDDLILFYVFEYVSMEE